MNLKKLHKVKDSDIFSLADEGISVDSILKELNAYLPSNTKKEFLEHCDNVFDVAENLSSGDLIDYVNSQLEGNSALLLSEANAYFSTDWMDAFIQSVSKDYDIGSEEDEVEEVEDSVKTPVVQLLKFFADEE